MILFDNTNLTSDHSLSQLYGFARKAHISKFWLKRSGDGMLYFEITSDVIRSRIGELGVKEIAPSELFSRGIRGDLPSRQARVRERVPIALRRNFGGTPDKARIEIVRQKRSNAVKKWPKPRKRQKTGELAEFHQIYQDCGGRSEITGKKLPFHVAHFCHVIAKGPNEKFRLKRLNIIHAEFGFHDLYDKRGKAKTLEVYPEAEWVYLLREWMLQLVNQETIQGTSF